MTLSAFQKIVWGYYRQHGRHELPWRKTRDPYKILVSEVMLQQTQVERVVPYYQDFIKQFPTPRRLAEAPLAAVLKAWQGLGYNRRAKYLREAARAIREHDMPKTIEGFEALPGVGQYTARAVTAFAFNQDVILIETNIRTVITHHFYKGKQAVSDAQLMKILERVLPKGQSREWYSALMDYGAYLKRSGVKLNSKSKHYTKQSLFRGSLRETRGAILKELAKGSQTKMRLEGLFGDDRVPQLATALTALSTEGLIQKRGRVFTLPR